MLKRKDWRYGENVRWEVVAEILETKEDGEETIEDGWTFRFRMEINRERMRR